MKFQTFRRVHGHQLNRILPCLSLIVACLQSRVREKSSQWREHARIRTRCTRSDVLRVALNLRERRRRCDQFVQIVYAVLTFALGFVMREQSTVNIDVIDQFGQGQMLRIKAHAINHFCKLRQFSTCRAAHADHSREQRAIMRARIILKHLDGARAYSACGEIHHAHKRGVVVRIVNQTQIRQRVFDFCTLKKAQTTVHAVRNARIEQRMFNHARLCIRSIQYRDVTACNTIGNLRHDFIDHKARF